MTQHKSNLDNATSVTVFSGPATAAAPQKANRFLSTNSSGQSVYTAAGEVADFVSLGTAESENAPIQGAQPTGAIIPVEAGGVIAVGDLVASGADGVAVVAAAGNAILGKAVVAAGAVGEVIGITFAFKGTA